MDDGLYPRWLRAVCWIAAVPLILVAGAYLSGLLVVWALPVTILCVAIQVLAPAWRYVDRRLQRASPDLTESERGCTIVLVVLVVAVMAMHAVG